MTDTATVEPGGTGLLDNVQVSDEAKPDNPQSVEIDHKATAPDAPAPDEPLERPDFWPENFWKKDSNEPDLEGIAKSWSDLRKQISQGKHKAPADGKYDLKSFGEQADTNPIATTLSSWAKDNGLSQAAFDDLVNNLQTQAKEIMQGDMVDPAAEMKQLGPNAGAIVNGMVDWARGLVNKGVWSKDDFEEFKIMGGTARGITALMKVREAYEGRVPTQSVQLEGAPSKDELYQMVNDPKYKSDPGYRQKVEKMFQATFR
ncbi:hypothetical protein UFOVP628_24 [uncultured Caudovirales phage]|uniref:Uncharacterized protein n=1 Tax=uncultured Caudovirales phage TaxID=2100421 RepID=A0A6J5N9K9_9CAUD|nr:hypothetical protein UFOVP628_24 [uncultured Caudovirales phage]